MRIGILGATGPAGGGLAARLASVGHEVLFGSRAVDKARAAVDELEKEWGDQVAGRLIACDNAWACDAPVVILAVHADSAIPTVQEHAERLAGQDHRLDGEQPREARQRVQRGAPAARVGARPRSRRCSGAPGSPPRSTSCPRPSSPRSTTRWRATSSCSATTTTPRRPSWRSRAASRTCARSTAARCATRSGWRRSRRCC